MSSPLTFDEVKGLPMTAEEVRQAAAEWGFTRVLTAAGPRPLDEFSPYMGAGWHGEWVEPDVVRDIAHDKAAEQRFLP